MSPSYAPSIRIPYARSAVRAGFPAILSMIVLIGLLVPIGLIGQTVTSNGTAVYNGGNGVGAGGGITFTVENLSGGDILITALESFWQTGQNGVIPTLRVRNVGASGSYAPFVAGDWTTIAVGSAVAVPVNGYYPTLSGLSYLLPNGTAKQFMLEGSSGIRYSGSGPITPNSFTTAGVSIRNGDYQIAGLNVGYGGVVSGTANTPRYFTGGITFMPAAACTGIPTAGAVSGSSQVCTGGSTTLSIVGSSTGTGITRNWFSSSVSGGPYSTPVGSGLSVGSGPIAANTYFVCVVTCTNSGQTATTGEFLVSPVGASPGGTFTINNTLATGGGNFNNFTDAINTLNGLGLCGAFTGPWVFNVVAGQTFNENPPQVTASGDAVNTITFQRSGAGANPVITPTGSASPNEAGLAVIGGDDISFNGIDINASAGTGVEYGYFLRNQSGTNGAQNITIQNCNITLNRGNTASYGILSSSSTLIGGGLAATAATGANSNLLLQAVTVSNCFIAGIRSNSTAAFPSDNEQILNCTVGAAYIGSPLPDIGTTAGTTACGGIWISNPNNVVVSGNLVRNLGQSSGVTKGLWVSVATGTNNVVSNNRVYGVRTYSTTSTTAIARGMEVNLAVTGAHSVRVFNNMIGDISCAYTGTVNANRRVSGLFLGNSGGLNTQVYDADFNSVSIDGSGSPNISSVCLELGGNTQVYNMRGNNLVNFTGAQSGVAVHHGVRVTAATQFGDAASVSDYNNVYIANATNGFAAQAATANFTTMALYDAAINIPASNDANSIAADPLFLSNTTDLHASGPAVNGAGLPGGLAWVTVDIDGDPRNNPPDIGADEFSPASCFPPVDVAVVLNTSSTATITWTNVAALNYDWEVRSSGAPGSGPVGLEDFGNVLAGPVNVTGLPSATIFAVYVRSNCTGPLTSNWSSAVAFETPNVVSSFPSCQDFESATLCVPSTCVAVLACTATALDPVLWENATTDGLGQWSVDEGGTSSTGTGPGTGAGTGQPDYFPGTATGNYVYMESGSCAGNTLIALSPVFDISSFTNPNVRVQMAWNMFGATMGTMAIDIEDPALSGNWTTLWSLSGNQGQGWFLTPTLDHAYTSTDVRYRVRGISGTSFTSDMAFDYFCVSEGPLCTAPIATVTAVTPDCVTNTMAIDVNVTSLGDATSVTVQYSVNAGPYLTACNLLAPGPCSITGLSATATVNVQVVHDQDNVCSIDLGDYALNDLTCITCGDPAIVETYCYTASDNESWQYVATGGGTLKLKFNKGTIETSGTLDILTIYDGPDNTFPVLFTNPANTGNLGAPGSAILSTDPDFFSVDVTATGPSLFMRLTSDTSVQCGSAGYDPWEWEVICLNCIQPSVSATIVEDCFGGSFTVEVTVNNTGDGATVDLESVPGSVEHNDVTASVTPYVMGPYLNGSVVNIFVRHENDATCDLDLGFFETACPPIVSTYPYCQDFEAANLCVPTTCVAVLPCTSTALDPVGWQNSTTDGSGQWSVDEGGTSSTSTGPGTGAGTGQPDYVPGTSTGNYVYMESGSCAGNTIHALSPIFDVSVFPNPSIRARMAYNMFGATMGTLAVDIEDPALSNNWTTLWSLSGDQGQGWFLTPFLDHTYTGTSVRYRVRGIAGTSFTSDMAFDYFCVRPTPLCTDPIAAVTSVTTDCNSGTLTVAVNVTSLGDATSVSVEYALNGGAYATACAGLVAPGPCQIVAGGSDIVSVRVVHDQDGDCGLDLGDYDAGAVQCITCGDPAIVETYCYVADDNQSWLYQSDGGGTLLLEFIRGTLETSTFDDLTIYDGPDNTSPILYASPANTGNLGPAGSAILSTDPDFFAVNVTATGNALFMTLTTDGSVQCATSATYDPWVWEVLCLDCTYPVATAAVVDNCSNAQYSVSVTITDAGSGGTVDIVSNLNGIEANDVGVGVHVVGPFTNGTPVALTLVHPGNTLCNLELGNFFDCCQGTCAFPNIPVIGTNTNGPINCGTPSNALVDGVTPNNARWWTYTLPAQGKVRVSSCNPPNTTNTNTFVTIHEGSCTALVPYTGDDDGCTTPTLASDVTFAGAAGQTFYIEWDDRSNGAGHAWDLQFTACAPPANDLCANENPAASPLSIGSPLVFTGTRDCATKDGTLNNIQYWDGVDEDVSGWVWESFQLTQCANVTINYCGSPVSGIVSLNMYGDCGSLFVNSQSFDFTTCAPNATIVFQDLAPGAYYYPVLWDARRASGPYTLNVIASTPTNPCPTNNTCAGAIPLACNSVTLGNTNNQLPTLPVNACPFPNSPVSGGSLWYSYTPIVSENVVVSTCGAGTLFDTRLDVYTGTCAGLSCLTLADDKGGACTNRSQLEFYGQAGITYYLVVHSATPFIDGAFEIAIGCGASCIPPANDVCATATGITSFLSDNAVYTPGIPTPGDNSCAQNDPFTSCALLANNQGMWYSFNSGPNTIHYLTLNTFDQDNSLSSTTMNYTLYSGGCNGLQGVTSAGCVINGDGDYVLLPGLTASTSYRLYLYNQGDAGFEGTFNVMLEHPGMNDAGIIDVNAPIGLVCTSLLDPKVVLKNFGETTLTSVTITYDLDGAIGPFSHVWTGTLPYLASEEVVLPSFTAPYGNHIFNVATSLPNGQPDQIPDNDALAEPDVNVTGETVIVEIVTDNDPSQLIWQIYDQNNQLVGVSPVYGVPNVMVPSELCLSTLNGNCFSFFLFDFLGDGLSQTANGNGSWRLRTENGADLLRDDFDGTVDGTFSPSVSPMSAWYSNGHPFCLPPGPTQPLPGECGLFTNNLQSKVYCKAIAGVTNYQFQFLRPDEGYSRQISVPRNWVKFGEMQTFPLSPGETYFCRVRGDQTPFGNYSTDRYGTGCEMGIDPSLVPGCTGLVDDIGAPAHSCGVIKVFGGSQKIWAQPVVGGTQYRFRFQNGLIDPDGPSLPGVPALGTRIITVPSYALVLSWTNFTLVNGSTYDVTIEVLVAGQWSGYCGSVCQVEIDNTPGQAQRAMEASTSSDLQVWPNPVRDGQVNVLIGGLTDDTQRITLDVFDIYGKRVMAFDKENSGSVFNTMLDMDGVAAGVYMVSVTVNDRVYQQRVSVL